MKKFLFAFSLISVFAVGLYFRNYDFGFSFSDIIPFVLDYFSVLHYLEMLIGDFSPNFLQTFFWPFKKFLSPFGVPDTTFYFDISHMLTDYYFPKAWEIRATEQWPVEADLYLNFFFIFGLPLIFGFFWFDRFFYGRAVRSNSIGEIAFGIFMVMSIFPHLRGSLYNFTDLYQYPMFFIICFMFRKN